MKKKKSRNHPSNFLAPDLFSPNYERQFVKSNYKRGTRRPILQFSSSSSESEMCFMCTSEMSFTCRLYTVSIDSKRINGDCPSMKGKPMQGKFYVREQVPYIDQ